MDLWGTSIQTTAVEMAMTSDRDAAAAAGDGWIWVVMVMVFLVMVVMMLVEKWGWVSIGYQGGDGNDIFGDGGG